MYYQTNKIKKKIKWVDGRIFEKSHPSNLTMIGTWVGVVPGEWIFEMAKKRNVKIRFEKNEGENV